MTVVVWIFALIAAAIHIVVFIWEAILIEAFRLIYEGEHFETQAALRKRVLDWHMEQHSRAPSDEAAKPKIRRLWNALGLGENR